MGLFSKKMTKEDILKAISLLSDEEKSELIDMLEDESEATDVVENDIEEKEEVKEEVEEKVEETDDTEEDKYATDEDVEEEVEEKVEVHEKLDDIEQGNKEDTLSRLVDRVSELERGIEELKALKELMEEYTKKQADSFGYKGKVPGAKKDYADMSAEELGRELATSI